MKSFGFQRGFHFFKIATASEIASVISSCTANDPTIRSSTFGFHPRKTMQSQTFWFYKLRPTNKSRYRSDEVNVFDLHPRVQKVVAVLFEDF